MATQKIFFGNKSIRKGLRGSPFRTGCTAILQRFFKKIPEECRERLGLARVFVGVARYMEVVAQPKKVFCFSFYLFLLAGFPYYAYEPTGYLQTNPDSRAKSESGPVLLAQTESVPDDIDKEIAESESTGSQQTQSTQQAQQIVTIDRSNMPNVLVAIDLVSEHDVVPAKSQDLTTNYMFVRSAEFGLFGAIDWFSNGQLLLAIHRDEGEYRLDLHEAWFEFPALPWNFHLKVGRLFPDAGRLNTIHQHDRSFTGTPRVHGQLFDTVIGEGFIDNGAELSWLAPLPWFTEFKAGIFNGRTFGHSHNDGFKKPLPLMIGRQKNFIPFSQGFGIQWGFTYIHYSPTRDKGDADHKYGTDIMLKYQRGRWTSLEISGEFWYHKEERVSVTPNDKTGFYIYVQYQPFERWKFGYRRDFFSRLNLQNVVTGQNYNGVDHADAIWIAYMTSEFFNAKLNLERQQLDTVLGEAWIVYAQAVYILGFHPAHRF